MQLKVGGVALVVLVVFTCLGQAKQVAPLPPACNLSVSTGASSAASACNLTIVDVFSAGESGFYCIKIPALIVTGEQSLLAFGEARSKSCSDFADTSLVYKQSVDGGKSWSGLQVLYSDPGHVIGNAAPVVVGGGVVVVPFCRDNREVFVIRSTDNGATWSPPKNITASVVRPHWPWVGTGPPGSLLLASPSPFAGRIVTPCYHTVLFHGDGELSVGHVMYSDDSGLTWQLGGDLTGNDHLSNECQAVQLANATLLINARGLGFRRLQTVSVDGGVSWSPLVATAIPEPTEGCEMSTITDPSSSNLYLSGPTVESLFRTHLSVWSSQDSGASWSPFLLVNEGPSGYSSMQWLPWLQSVGLLFERSATKAVVFVPDHISFAPLPSSLLPSSS